MITRVLVAVDDTGASIRAASVAAELADRTGCRLRALNVFQDGVLTGFVAEVVGDGAVEEARRVAGSSILEHVGRIARSHGVCVESCERDGEPGPEILAEARAWGADLVVLGRSAPRAGGSPKVVDGVNRHVLEFSDVPVLLVP